MQATSTRMYNKYNQWTEKYILNEPPDLLTYDDKLPPVHWEKPTPGLAENKKNGNIRIPGRLDMPLVPFPTALRDYIQSPMTPSSILRIHKFKRAGLRTLMEAFYTTVDSRGIVIPDPNDFIFDIEAMSMINQYEIIQPDITETKAARVLATKCIGNDMKVLMDRYDKDVTETYDMPEIPQFIHFMQKSKFMIPLMEKNNMMNTEQQKFDRLIGCYIIPDTNIVVSYANLQDNVKTILVWNNDYFAFYIGSSNKVIIGDMEHLDFMLTVSEILFNLEIIKSVQEFAHMHHSFSLIQSLLSIDIPHNSKVTIMKSLEGICLMKSDIVNTHIVSWAPIDDAMNEILAIDIPGNMKDTDGISRKDSAMRLFNGVDDVFIGRDFILNFLKSIINLTGPQLQELSSVHKFIYYAEVDTISGLRKYIKRVHTKRPFEQHSIDRMSCVFKQMFTYSFVQRNKVSPVITSPLDKAKLIESDVLNHQMDRILARDLSWWSDIEFGETLSKAGTHDPVEKAKDKGALKPKISFGPGDSQRELLQTIEMVEYDISEFDLDDFKDVVPPKVWWTKQQESYETYQYACRLIEKEREQKIDARYFGNTSITNKHILSRYMDMCKVVLDFFSGQIMTISDKKRKEILHRAGQFLLTKGYYSILLDIEGHNQSMQLGNTGPLLKIVGQLFGYKDWNLLANYFNHLTVYHYDTYYDRVMISQGQLGGIEGWMNPFWTLHTTLVCQLFIRDNNITSPIQMIYGDDVNIIVKMEDLNDDKINVLYEEIEHYFMKFGMVVKRSQTMVSSTRCTMLRRHYYNGVQADSTLKRLLTVSAFNENALVNEQIELTAIDSSCSSAMEYTNNLKTCIILKWYRAIFLILRPFLSLINKLQDPKVVRESLISASSFPQLMRFSANYNIVFNRSELLKEGGLNTAIKNTVMPVLQKHHIYGDYEEVYGLLTEVLHGTIGDTVNLNKVNSFYYLVCHDEAIQDLIIYRLLMPVSFGGYGFSLSLNSSLSGYSNGSAKKLYYIHRLITKAFANPRMFLIMFTHALCSHDQSIKYLSETKLVTSEFPTDNKSRSANSIITDAITRYIKKRCKNLRILELLDLDTNKQAFMQSLIDLNRDKFTYRIVSFLFENSKYHILDILLKKIETSRGFFGQMNNIHHIRGRVFFNSMEEGLELFSMSDARQKDLISSSTDILQYLLNQRNSRFPRVKHVDITEPLYDHMMTETLEPENQILTIHFNTATIVKDGRIQKLGPKYGSEVTYKGEITREYAMFDYIEQVMAFRVTAITKWIINNSQRDQPSQVSDQLAMNNNILSSTKLVLSTLTTTDYDDIAKAIDLPSGGEVLHRIPNTNFRGTSYIRVLPSIVPKLVTVTNMRFISDNRLDDSNINFDYFKYRYQLANSIEWKYYPRKMKFVKHYIMKPGSTIKDVKVSFLSPPGVVKHPDTYEYKSLQNGLLDLNRLKAISYNILISDTDVSASAQMSTNLINTFNMDSDLNKAMLIYLEYRRLVTEHMYFTSIYSSMSSWLPFIERFRPIFLAWNLQSNEFIFSDIRMTLKNLTNAQLSIVNRFKRIFNSELIIELLLSEFEITFAIASTSLEKYFSLLRLEIARSDEIRADKITTIITNELSHMEEQRWYLIRIMFKRLVIKYCLSLEYANGEIILNTTLTEKNVILVLGQFELIMKDSIELRMLRVAGLPYLRELFSTESDMILDEISDVLSNINYADVATYDARNEPKAKGSYLTLKGTSSNLWTNVVYTGMAFDIAILYNWGMIHKMMSWIRDVTDIYASPGINESPTGSDSYIPQKSIFYTLMNEKYITEDDYLCNLTAGRGDGHLAAKELGIKRVDSFSRRDKFNEAFTHQDIITSLEYDVTNPETLQFLLSYSVIMIDVSHMGNDNDMTDTIIWLLRQRKKVVLRINSINITPTDILEAELQRDVNIKLYYASSGNYKPYQIYMVIDPTKHRNMVFTDTALYKSHVVINLTNNYLRLTTTNNVYNIPDIPTNNSVMHIIPDTIDINEFISESEHTEVNQNYISAINRCLRDIRSTNSLPIVWNKIPKPVRQMIENDLPDLDDIPRTNERFSTNLNLNMISKNAKFSPAKKDRMIQHLKALQSSNSEKVIINPSYLSQDTLLAISQIYPDIGKSRTCRDICEVLTLIPNFGTLEDNEKINDLTIMKTELLEEMGLTDDSWSKNMRAALKYIVMAAYKKNYRAGIDDIWKNYTNEFTSKGKWKAILTYYRKLYSKYMDLCNISWRGINTRELQHQLDRLQPKVWKSDTLEKSARKGRHTKNHDLPEHIESARDQLYLQFEDTEENREGFLKMLEGLVDSIDIMGDHEFPDVQRNESEMIHEEPTIASAAVATFGFDALGEEGKVDEIFNTDVEYNYYEWMGDEDWE